MGSDDDESTIANLLNKIEEGISYNKSLFIHYIVYYFKQEDWYVIDKIIDELKKNGYTNITRQSDDGEHIIIKWDSCE
jgi:hypothetical protein